jgi:EAL and modified HD-GYP domain-containing signal transduction protein
MDANQLYVARQPIFDRDKKVWGCKLLYRESEAAGAARYLDGEEATLKVAASLLVSPDQEFRSGCTMVTVSRDFLLQGMVQGLELDKPVVGVRSKLLKDKQVLDALRDLKGHGYKLSVDLRGGEWSDVPAPELFDVAELPWTDLQPGGKPKSMGDVLLLVKRIETHEQADQAREAGADLLQGFFFEKPRTYRIRPLTATSLSRLKILQILESRDEDLESLSAAIESDVSLALRLLKLVNSASFALARRIESVRQAASLVGWNKLKNWLRLIVVTDMTPSRVTNELAYSSAVRAKFLELAAQEAGRDDLADRLYMLGLFSLLEALLEASFADVFRELQLDEDVQAALLDFSGPFKGWLSLARLMDTANWLALDSLAAELGLSMKQISSCRMEAFDWAKDFFQSMG